MKGYIYQIFLVQDYVTEESWLKFILDISKLNGRFKFFKIYMQFERNEVKYYLRTKRKMPTIISSSSEFLIKTEENFKKLKTNLNFLYLVTNEENKITKIYEKNESKYRQVLKQVEIKILPFSKTNYLTKSKLYFENHKRRLSKARALFFIPHLELSIDFGIHTRFLYSKENRKYLSIDKSMKYFQKEEQSTNILKVNTFPYTEEKYYLNLENYDFDKHSLIVGASGTGKSKFISKFISTIYQNDKLRENYKIIVIDPHSSLENDINIDDKKIINMKDKNSNIDLWLNDSKNASTSAEIIITILKTILAEQYNSKLERVLRYATYILIKKESLSFQNLRKLLTNTAYKNEIIKASEDLEENVIEFFQTDFNEIKTKSYQEAISPIIGIIDQMEMLPAFKNESNIKVKDLINENFLNIFSINQAILGEKVTKIISGLIMGIIFQLVQSSRFNQHIILIVDEVAVVENPILKSILSEARKYNLSLILAGQYLGQLSKEIKESIFSNVINYYAFRISREDAVILNNQMQMEMAVKNTYSNRIKLLSEMPNRELIVRIGKQGKLIPAFRAKTLDMENVTRNQILIKSDKKEIELVEKNIEKDFNFTIGKAIDLRELMNSQSTSRRKVKYE